MPTEETMLKKSIREYLELCGYKVYRMPASIIGSRVKGCPPGTPDLLAIGQDGFSVWIEVKTKTGRLSEVQKDHIAELESRGQYVLVVSSVDQLTGVWNARA